MHTKETIVCVRVVQFTVYRGLQYIAVYSISRFTVYRGLQYIAVYSTSQFTVHRSLQFTVHRSLQYIGSFLSSMYAFSLIFLY